jgi:hypothetical protein
VIATPDHWHAYIAIAAVKAGKDVYCEKPLTYSVREAVELVKAVRSTQRVFPNRFPATLVQGIPRGGELVRNGVIGKVGAINVSFGDPAKPYAEPVEAMEPGLDWKTVVWPRSARRLQPLPEPARRAQALSPLAEHLGIRRRHDHRLGRPSYRHRPVGPERGRERPGRDPRPAELGNRQTWRPVDLRRRHGAHAHPGRGVSFYGTEGEIHVNRGKFEFILDQKTVHKFWDKEVDKTTSLDREVILTQREFLADAKVKLYESSSHFQDFVNCGQVASTPHLRCRDRCEQRDRLPPHELRLSLRRQREVESGQEPVCQWRQPQVAGPRSDDQRLGSLS